MFREGVKDSCMEIRDPPMYNAFSFTPSRDLSGAVYEGQYDFSRLITRRLWRTVRFLATSHAQFMKDSTISCNFSGAGPTSLPQHREERVWRPALLHVQPLQSWLQGVALPSAGLGSSFSSLGKLKRSEIRLVFSSSNFVPPDILGHLFLRPLLWNRPPDLNFLVHVQFLDCTGNVSFIPSSLNELWPNWLMRIYKNNAMIISFKKDLISVTSFDFILWYVKRIRLSVPLLRWRGIFAF